MGEHVIKLPDVGEGVAEAEIVEWLADIGTNVREDEILANVMTDKATVEIPSPVEGKVIWRAGEVGDILAVGAPLLRLEVEGAGNVKPGEASDAQAADTKQQDPAPPTEKKASADTQSADTSPAPKAPSPKMSSSNKPTARRPEGDKPVASPAVRKRAADAGVDLRRVHGSGPAGRVSHEDLDAYLQHGLSAAPTSAYARNRSVEEIPVVGLRRKIAEKMTRAATHIPHITYVEEVDVTALEALRAQMNASRKEGRAKLTLLPYLMRAMIKAINDQPIVNAVYDEEAGVVHQYGGVHMGVATQTPNGLMVPVLRHVEARDIWECASELSRLSEAAKSGEASREELSGSTITITSLGALGGIVTTPVINHPEVAIVGVNKIQTLPRWDGGEFVPRKVMNLSSSFDHRIVDGWNAAVFIQRIKTLLENPAMIFVED